MVTVMMVFLVVKNLFPVANDRLPFISALLFAIHPIHTEVVANIKSRDEILCLLLGLLSVYFLIRYVATKRLQDIILACLIYFVCFLSKESAITLLGVFPLVVWYKSNSEMRSAVRLSILFIGVACTYMIIRYAVLGSITGSATHQLINNSLLGASNFGEQLGSALMILGKYLYLLIIPHPLSFDYSYNQIPLVGIFSVAAMVSAIIYVGLSIWALLNLKTRNVAAFGIMFFIVTISLVSNVLFLIESSMAERFLYMPSFGFCIGMAWLISNLFKLTTVKQKNLISLLKGKPVLLLILIIITFSYGYKTVARNSDWKDNITLLKKDVKTAPNSARIRYAYGSAVLIEKALQEENSVQKNAYLDESIVQFEKGVSILNSYSEAWYHLGLAYKEKGNGAQAIRAFETAKGQKVFTKPDFFIASGIAYGMTGNYNMAIADLQHAISLEPDNAEAYNNLGLYYSDKGVLDSSLSALNRAIELKESFPEAWYNKGNAYAKGNAFNEAIDCYTKALQLKQDYTDAQLNIGNCYAALQNYQKAIEYYDAVVQKEPYNKNALINLGITYNIIGNESKGQEYISRAEKL
jgi:tetratricopeptide (TPR) repeat protein